MLTSRRTWLSIALFSLSLNAFSADEIGPASAPQATATSPGFHLTLNMGLTYGGDTIGTVTFSDGSTSKLKAGSLMQIGIGGLYQAESAPLALMLSGNYHFDSASAKNGTASFDRFPIETLVFYTGLPQVRVGGGGRYIKGASLNSDIGGKDEIVFKDTTGLVAEVGYQIDPHGWINVRAVSEKFQAKSRTVNGVTTSLIGTTPASGTHLGVNFSYEY